ncbi:MAG TPA: ubiquinol-cytochrome c reductase iron-sulfur subunit [Jiangellaceae bacterium]
MAISRRNVLLRGWKLGGALLAVAAAWTAYESLRPLAQATEGGSLALGKAQRFGPGTATYVSAARLYVVNAEGHYFALSQKCPHLGCRVPFCDSSGRFECPCHGSVFDLAGEYVKGPSPRGMDRYELTVQGDELVVDTGAPIRGPDRGEERFLTPPRGPSCVEGA